MGMLPDVLKVLIIKERGVFPVKKYLRILADEDNNYNFRAEPDQCVIKACPGGTVVLLNKECCNGRHENPGYKELAYELSKIADGTVMSCYIFDNDFWGYYLYDNGEEEDFFCPIPDYFGEVTEEQAKRCMGDEEILSSVFGVPPEILARYLVRWTEDGIEGKACPEDTYGYEPMQVVDFIHALGFTLPLQKDSTTENTAIEDINTDKTGTGELFTEETDAGSMGTEIITENTSADAAVTEGLFTKEVVTENINMDKDSPGKALPGARKEQYHFQVNLGGMLDILSNHLYKSPDVFIRELLQNGVDAITLRQKEQPWWNDGKIIINVEPGRRIEFIDNGAGLNEEGIHRFLAVIGMSSKTQLINGQLPEDYIGRFGIGLLSCFMVSDTIVVYTRPSDGGAAHVWTGFPDGTYTLEPASQNVIKTGTMIILEAKHGEEHYFYPDKVEELVEYYGLALPVPIYMPGKEERINKVPHDFSGIGRGQLLSFGTWLFNEEFLDAIPVQTPHLSGAAYILPYRTGPSLKSGHRIYLKQMLLTEEGNTLLPPWAFFLRCFLNTKNLRPVASREDFYEDEELETARREFEEAVHQYLKEMAEYEPARLQSVVNVHSQAIKAMAVWDDDMFGLFIDYLQFETSEGLLTGAVLKQCGEAAWVSSVQRFNQLKPLFMAQGKLLICTGYVSDEELVHKLTSRFSLPFAPLHEENMSILMEDLQPYDKQRVEFFLDVACNALEGFDCNARIKRFLPASLPVLYSMDGEVRFFRQLQSARDISSDIFSDALSSLIKSVDKKPLATLYFNFNSTLIQRLAGTQDTDLLKSISKVLYVQALLAGGHPLRSIELKVMNNELLNLVDNSLQN